MEFVLDETESPGSGRTGGKRGPLAEPAANVNSHRNSRDLVRGKVRAASYRMWGPHSAREISMSKSFHLAIIAAAVLAAVPALAETPGSARRFTATENRDARQDTRIDNGVTGGGINANEAARLEAQQARIDTSETRLAADGNFSRRDYARIDYRQDKANRSIFRARNNRR
jgi:hypothetical protein